MSGAVRAIRECVADALAPHEAAGDVILAVSGGRDSVVLLHAAAAVARGAVRAVATFDHGTGPHAVAAATTVREQAAALGLPVVSGVAGEVARTEAEWREARWRFLRAAVADLGARVVATAHTADDQIETVAMRALRGAGARGLAALAARAGRAVRPLLAASRVEVAAYAAECGLRWVEDPSNADRRHARARVRADLLPAVARVRPGAAGRLGAAAARAAAWRGAADAWTATLAGAGVASEVGASDAAVPVAALAALGPDALAVFWPAFAARAGVRLDRRAIARLVAFTARAVRRVGDGTVQPARVPVAGAPPAAVELRCAPDPVGGNARAWQFAVRTGVRPGRGATDDSPPPNGAVGVAAPGLPDYA